VRVSRLRSISELEVNCRTETHRGVAFMGSLLLQKIKQGEENAWFLAEKRDFLKGNIRDGLGDEL
jgi:hypothetical protein